MQRRRIWITPEADLGAVLSRERDAIVFSFGSPTRRTPRPEGLAKARFQPYAFNDIAIPQEGLVPPSEEDVAQLISEICKSAREALVFQCWFGISRSTAAALIADNLVHGTQPAVAAQRLREAAPWATPNALMIELADWQLDLGGTLVSAVRQIGRGEDASTGRAVALPFAG